MRPFCWRNGLSREIRRKAMESERQIHMVVLTNPGRLKPILWVATPPNDDRTPCGKKTIPEDICPQLPMPISLWKNRGRAGNL
jgi:hypothetical protein